MFTHGQVVEVNCPMGYLMPTPGIRIYNGTRGVVTDLDPIKIKFDVVEVLCPSRWIGPSK